MALRDEYFHGMIGGLLHLRDSNEMVVEVRLASVKTENGKTELVVIPTGNYTVYNEPTAV